MYIMRCLQIPTVARHLSNIPHSYQIVNGFPNESNIDSTNLLITSILIPPYEDGVFG